MQAFSPAYGEATEPPHCLRLSSQGSAKDRQKERVNLLPVRGRKVQTLACCLGVVVVKKPLPPGHKRREKLWWFSILCVSQRDGWMELLTCQHTLEEDEEEKVEKQGKSSNTKHIVEYYSHCNFTLLAV